MRAGMVGVVVGLLVGKASPQKLVSQPQPSIFRLMRPLCMHRNGKTGLMPILMFNMAMQIHRRPPALNRKSPDNMGLYRGTIGFI